MTQRSWSANDISDLSNHVAIITGANSGLGYEIARQLTKNKAHCVLACRNTAKAEQATKKLAKEFPFASLEIMPIDLANLASVHTFAKMFTKKYHRLDFLINNAGVMMTPKKFTIDGFEQQLGINHLGHFALTGLLLSPLLNTLGSRVITMSSIAHKAAQMDFDNLFFKNGGYSPQIAYRRSKLANLLFTLGLKKYFLQNGIDTKALSAHPGVTMTHLGDHLFKKHWYLKPLRSLLSLTFHPPSAGALSALRAISDPTLKSGEFIGPKKFKESRGTPSVVATSPAVTECNAKRLWEISEELTNIRYPQRFS